MMWESETDTPVRRRREWQGRKGTHLLQGLQYGLTVHLQHVQPGLILDPAVGHHRHQVEADVMVGLPAVTATAVRAAPTPAPLSN